MKNLVLKLTLSTFLAFNSASAQVDESRNSSNSVENSMSSDIDFSTPDGLMDHVFDRFGNRYNLRDIMVDKGKKSKEVNGSSPTKAATTQISCSSGYFDLYFEVGSGMEIVSDPIHIARRDVLCKLFSDLSSFINSPLTANGGKVNIWVRDFSLMTGAPGGSSSVLGVASSFYNIPATNAQTAGSIVENEISKTLRGGIDSYTNVTTPIIITLGSSTTTLYHGAIAFNFANTSSNIWHYDLLSAPSGSMTRDFYTVALHEVTHALGFASLIDQMGTSQFSAGFEYFSKYDLFLRTNDLSAPILSNTGTCVNYNYQFNPSLSTTSVSSPIGCVAATSTNTTNCSASIMYDGISNIPVYNPTCYENGSSLSHFEDYCFPTASNAANNDNYFVMSNGTLPSAQSVKRYLKPEERNVLCDLGYSVNSSYGSGSTFFSYGSGTSCSPETVIGVNDGLTNSNFNFTTNVNTSILINNVLANDINATSIECVQDMYDPSASITMISGNTSFNFIPTTPGIHLIRYTPVSANGIRGNTTYIYVSAVSIACVVPPYPGYCNLIVNGDFENSTQSCGLFNGSFAGYPDPGLSCWSGFTGTPDLLSNGGCFTNNLSFLTLPFTCTTPATNTYNFGTTPANNKLLHLAAGHTSASSAYSEGVQTVLTSSMIPGIQYFISFRAKIINSTCPANPTANAPTFLQIAGSQNPGTSGFWYFNTMNGLPAGTTDLGATPLLADGQWNYYFYVYTHTGTNPIDYILIYNGVNLNPQSYLTTFGGSTGSYNSSIFIDEVSIIPMEPPVNILPPGPMCSTASIPDLTSLIIGGATNGVFSGNGVNQTGQTYSFNPTSGGIYDLTYTYMNNHNCPMDVYFQINVVTAQIPVFNTVPAICAGTTLAPLPLTSNNGILGTWSPAINNTATTTYIFTPDPGQCAATATMIIAVDPIILPTFTPIAPICSGASLSALPTTSNNGINGTWSPAINNMATTTYTFTPDQGQCAVPTTMTIDVNQLITPTFNPINACLYVSIPFTNTSLEGITGSWSPMIPQQNNTWWFTPDPGQCASGTSLTVTVYPSINPINCINTSSTGTTATVTCSTLASLIILNNFSFVVNEVNMYGVLTGINFPANAIATGANSFTIGGLLPDSYYMVEILTLPSSYACVVGDPVFYIATEQADCSDPVVITAQYMNGNSITIEWGGAQNVGWYEIRYKPQSASSWITPYSTTGGSNYSYTVTSSNAGILPNTNYVFEVRRYCSNGSISPWSNNLVVNSGSLVECALPPVTAISAVTGATALITWSPVQNVAWFEWRYRIAGTSNWILSGTLQGGILSHTLTGLTQNTLYEFQIRSFCYNGVPSNWGSLQFQTSGYVNCEVIPTINTIPTGVTQTSLTISWVAGSGIAWYSFRIKPNSSSTWGPISTAGGNATTKTFTGLTPNTLWDIQMRFHCSNGTSSPWSTTQSFQTPSMMFGNSSTNNSTSSNIKFYDQKFKVLIHPNPSNGYVFLKSSNYSGNVLEVSVTDITGKLILNDQLQIYNEEAQFEINASSGTYLIKLTDPISGEYVVEKLIIEK